MRIQIVWLVTAEIVLNCKASFSEIRDNSIISGDVFGPNAVKINTDVTEFILMLRAQTP